MQLTKAIG